VYPPLSLSSFHYAYTHTHTQICVFAGEGGQPVQRHINSFKTSTLRLSHSNSQHDLALSVLRQNWARTDFTAYSDS